MARMSEQLIFAARSFSGNAAEHLVESRYRHNFMGYAVSAIPPGRVDIDHMRTSFGVHILPSVAGIYSDVHRVNGAPTRYEKGHYDVSVMTYCSGAQYRLVSANTDWSLLFEIEDDELRRYANDGCDIAKWQTGGLSGHNDPASAHLAGMVLAQLRSRKANYLFLECLTTAILSRTISKLCKPTDDASVESTDQRLQRAMDHIDNNLSSSLCIAECAKVAAMSPSWFARSFSSAIGETVHSYVNRKRVETARALLISSQLSIAEIAYDTGFADHSHLSRTFKKITGFSPSALRS